MALQLNRMALQPETKKGSKPFALGRRMCAFLGCGGPMVFGLCSFFQGVELGGLHILTNPSVLEKNNDAISRMSRNCRFSEAFELAYLLFTAEGPNRTFPVGVATPNHVSSINNW